MNESLAWTDQTKLWKKLLIPIVEKPLIMNI